MYLNLNGYFRKIFCTVNKNVIIKFEKLEKSNIYNLYKLKLNSIIFIIYLNRIFLFYLILA